VLRRADGGMVGGLTAEMVKQFKFDFSRFWLLFAIDGTGIAGFRWARGCLSAVLPSGGPAHGGWS